MRFTTPLSLICLVTSAYSYVVERDLKTVETVLADVQGDIDNLDTTVKAFNGDPEPVRSASSELINTINDGTAKVKATSDLSLSDTIALLGPVDELKEHAQTLVDDLKAKRPAVQDGKLCGDVRQQITSIKKASQGLTEAIVSKVPQSAKNIARDKANEVNEVLAEAEEAYSPANCKA